MIISASRRTDIPAFFSDWMIRRLREGFAYVKNPLNPRQISEVKLDPSVVDCLVFWTKNPKPLLVYLREMEARGFVFYFQFSLTPYDGMIERNLPDKRILAETFKRLSHKIGPQRVVWRYDPILLSERITAEYHIRQFERLAKSLAGSTKRCVISFLDFYEKTKRNTRSLGLLQISPEQMLAIGQELGAIGKAYGLEMFTCAEAIDLTPFGIRQGKCIDDGLIETITGVPLSIKKDPNQRRECGCAQSIDLGTYNTCLHQCLYCYANHRIDVAAKRVGLYDPDSPLLCGLVGEEDQITVRKMVSGWIKK